MKIKIHRTVFASVVLFGCEKWVLTLRKEHRLTLFEKRVRGRNFGRGMTSKNELEETTK
jgi:hypothetical protein